LDEEVSDEYEEIGIAPKQLPSVDEVDATELDEYVIDMIVAYADTSSDLDMDGNEKEETVATIQEKIETDGDSPDRSTEELLADQGNPAVAFDAHAAIEDGHFHLKGESNLPGGTTVLMSS